MLDSLLKVEDLVEEDNRQRRVELENALDEALDSGEIVDCIDKALGDHRYSKDYKLEEKALRYFSGYVARKARKTSTAKTCQECFVALSAPVDQEHMAIDDIIVARSKGNLIIPSDKLWDLVRALEVAVLDTIHVKNLTSNIIFAGKALRIIPVLTEKLNLLIWQILDYFLLLMRYFIYSSS